MRRYGTDTKRSERGIVPVWKEKDIITIILDCEEWIVQFELNDRFVGEFDIKEDGEKGGKGKKFYPAWYGHSAGTIMRYLR